MGDPAAGRGQTVAEALAQIVASARGALEWHVEGEEPELLVPRGFQAPPLGRIPLIRPPQGQARPAPRAEAPSRRPAPTRPTPPPRLEAPTPRPVVEAPRPSKAQTLPPFARAEAPRPPAPALPPAAEAAAGLQVLRDEIGDCRACPLHERRQELVFGAGRPDARLMMIGGAPGRLEDYLGAPFLEQGQLLADMLRKGLGLRREEVYLTYLLKCTPAGRGLPAQSPSACRPYLLRQIELIKPEAIVLFDELVAQVLLETRLTLMGLRGKWHEFQGIPVRVTLHPHVLERTPSLKGEAWADLQRVIERLKLRR